jgi:hypothetical protein
VTRLNKKIFALVIMAVSALILIPLTNAEPQPQEMTTWTDKPGKYAPGEVGTLNIVFYNSRASAVTIQKIIGVFNNWRAYKSGQWEGNQTLTVNQAVVSKGVYTTSVTFTVPTDGRAVSTSVDITIQTTEVGDIGPLYGSVAVTTTPRFMDQIVTLFTIQVVLIIVCTVIIAATIFLSVRRPQATWRTEEKAQ